MNEMPTNDLSPSGRARRDAMLHELTLTMRRTGRVRRRRRQVLTACVAVAGLSAILRLGLVSRPHDRQAPPMAERLQYESGQSPALTATTPRCVVIRVETDPDIVDRLRARPARVVALLDDRALLDTLVAINRPAGLIRYEREARLTAAVTDAERGAKQ